MNEDEDFATLFEASIKAKQFDKGQTIEGRIVGIGPEVAFVDVGGKGEALIDIAELRNADGALEVKVGDRITATVVSTSGGITLSRKLARKAADTRHLADAFESGLPVEGRIERVVKGGYEVRVGSARAFCPLSQIDIARTTDPVVHEGQVYTFRVIEYKEGGRNVVVSRRKHLEEQQRASAADMRLPSSGHSSCFISGLTASLALGPNCFRMYGKAQCASALTLRSVSSRPGTSAEPILRIA